VQLFEEKTGRREPEDIGDKDCVKYGKEAEHYLRELFKLDFPQYLVTYDEFKMIHNAEHPFIFATLDGEIFTQTTKISDGVFVQNYGVLEIKTATIENWSQAREWTDGNIPQIYYIQCLHQLLATGYDFIILKAQLKYGYGDKKIVTLHRTIERTDVEADLRYLLQKEIEFWGYVERDERPNQILPEI
jgi:predicted phage-related endonuclease